MLENHCKMNFSSFDANFDQDKAISKTWLYDVSIIAAKLGYE